jgi:hypothetical protein
MNRTALITLEIIIAALVLMFIIGTYLSSGFYYDALIWVLLIAFAFGALYGLKNHNTPNVRRVIAIVAIVCLGVSFTGFLINIPMLPATPVMAFTLSMALVLLDWRMKRQDGESGIQDERTIRLGTYGIACSWYLTYVMVIFLSVAITMGRMQIPAKTVLLILIIIMPISTIIFQYYYNRKGDIF